MYMCMCVYKCIYTYMYVYVYVEIADPISKFNGGWKF